MTRDVNCNTWTFKSNSFSKFQNLHTQKRHYDALCIKTDLLQMTKYLRQEQLDQVSRVHSDPCQSTKMEPFAKIVNA